MRNWRRTRAKKIAIYLMIAIILLIAIFPVYWLVTTSFKERLQSLKVPPVWLFKPTLKAYYRAITGEIRKGYGIPYMRSLMTSTIVSFTTTVVSMILGSLAGYGLSRFWSRATKYISFSIISTRMIPPIVYIFPLYTIMDRIKLLDTHLGLILAYTSITLPYATWIMLMFFKGIPTSLDDAAMIDGCSRFGAFIRVVLPITRAGLAAATIYCFMIAWQEFLIGLMLGGVDVRPLTVALSLFVGQREIFWNELAAAGTIATLPILILLLTVQKHLIKGMMAGAVTG